MTPSPLVFTAGYLKGCIMGLVYIGKVINIESIPNADRIERLDVVTGHGGKWSGIAVKGQFQTNDPCQVYLQDSIVPVTPEFAFMERHHYRVRMVRLRGVPSECLIMPQTIPGEIGDDVTDAAGVTKYEKPLPAGIGDIAGHFPSFIPKSDEPNFQGVPELVEALRGKTWYATVKADGMSSTIYYWQDHIGVCSRNYEIKPSDHGTLWRLARKYYLDKNLPSGYAIQGEVVGPGIQSNPLGLKEVDFLVFNIYNITEKRYLDIIDTLAMIDNLGLSLVATARQTNTDGFNLDADRLRNLAEQQVYPNGKPAEGIVVRPLVEQTVIVDGTLTRLSFKCLNLLYTG